MLRIFLVLSENISTRFQTVTKAVACIFDTISIATSRLVVSFPRKIWISRQKKGKHPRMLMKPEMMMGVVGWQWHQLDEMQIIFASCCRHIITSAPHQSVLWQAKCSSWWLTNSVKTLKATRC